MKDLEYGRISYPPVTISICLVINVYFISITGNAICMQNIPPSS